MAHEPIIPRARLGFIIPSSNRNSEPDIQHFAPDRVVPHFMRLRMSGPHRVPLDELMPRIAEAASILADTKCDVITLHCTGTSMSGGFGAEREVMKTITEATGRPGLATATCLMTALKALNARKLVFISESPEEGHGEKRSFLQEAGYEIVGDKPASLAGSDEACITPPAFWADMARDTMVPGADAIFISCANILATHVIEELEAELNVPVVTSNQVVLWHALRTAGYADPIPGLGRLGTMAEAPALAAE
jgi:maleate cis-trans isomerase